MRAIFAALPGLEVLVIGQGTSSRMMVDAAVRRALEKAGLEVIALDSATACQRYNALRKTRKTAAALHLTC